jgi:hypothetical protein
VATITAGTSAWCSGPCTWNDGWARTRFRSAIMSRSSLAAQMCSSASSAPLAWHPSQTKCPAPQTVWVDSALPQ